DESGEVGVVRRHLTRHHATGLTDLDNEARLTGLQRDVHAPLGIGEFVPVLSLRGDGVVTRRVEHGASLGLFVVDEVDDALGLRDGEGVVDLARFALVDYWRFRLGQLVTVLLVFLQEDGDGSRREGLATLEGEPVRGGRLVWPVDVSRE